MTDHCQVYQQEAEQYQRLISREDYQGNLLPAIRSITPLDGLDLVDLGAGTGRLSCLLGPHVRSTSAFDISAHMLETAAVRVASLDMETWLAAAADHRRIPLASASADLVVSGWSLCYLVLWEQDGLQALEQGLREIGRILRKGGRLVIMETLGTGEEQPQPPEELSGYYSYLQQSGFNHTWIRTDYQFHSQAEAQELVGFFFGPDLVGRIGPEQGPVLPECTGLWWRTKE